jgi:outer membrane protein assembly factor BamB
MKNRMYVFFLLLFLAGSVYAQKISEWRPENRTGVSAETGLLASWPAEGPKQLWINQELGKGNSSPVFGENTLYITGLDGDNDALYALDLSGKLLWKSVIGRAWTESYPESRCTPTLEGNRVYTSSGMGDLACTDATTGKIVWTYKASEVNQGTYGNWGIAESLLIDGDKLYFSPGGPLTMTIAVNKNTGALIWKSKSLNDKAGYTSPILVNFAGIKMLIGVSLSHVFAVDVSNGQILWSVANFGTPQWGDHIICVTPLYKDGMVYTSEGYNAGGMMVKIAPDGKSASRVWTDEVLDMHHGGVVAVNGYIYGSNWINNGDGNWCCIEWATGKKMWEEHWNCKGSIISAEGMLYLYDEKNGNVGLVKANPEKFEVVSSFRAKGGSAGPYWAHPVIHNGVLYIRHTNALMAYDIKKK